MCGRRVAPLVLCLSPDLDPSCGSEMLDSCLSLILSSSLKLLYFVKRTSKLLCVFVLGACVCVCVYLGVCVRRACPNDSNGVRRIRASLPLQQD